MKCRSMFEEFNCQTFLDSSPPGYYLCKRKVLDPVVWPPNPTSESPRAPSMASLPAAVRGNLLDSCFHSLPAAPHSAAPLRKRNEEEKVTPGFRRCHQFSVHFNNNTFCLHFCLFLFLFFWPTLKMTDLMHSLKISQWMKPQKWSKMAYMNSTNYINMFKLNFFNKHNFLIIVILFVGIHKQFKTFIILLSLNESLNRHPNGV